MPGSARCAGRTLRRRGSGVKPYPEVPPSDSLSNRPAPCCASVLDRPARRNSITDPIVYALADTVDAAASDETVRVMHLEGSGDHFSSGFDLSERTPGPDRPRVGSGAPAHERARQPPHSGHAHLSDSHRLQARGCGSSDWASTCSSPLTSPSWPTTPGCGAPFTTFGFTPDSGCDLAHTAPGRSGPGQGDAHTGRQGERIGRGRMGASSTGAVPSADLDAAGQELITRLATGSDRGPRSYQTPHAPGRHGRNLEPPGRRSLGDGDLEPLGGLQGVRRTRRGRSGSRATRDSRALQPPCAVMPRRRR